MFLHTFSVNFAFSIFGLPVPMKVTKFPEMRHSGSTTTCCPTPHPISSTHHFKNHWVCIAKGVNILLKWSWAAVDGQHPFVKNFNRGGMHHYTKKLLFPI